jgi:hypothetical protein
MKKLLESFKYGIEMYANSLYGDINCHPKKLNVTNEMQEQLIRKSKKECTHLTKPIKVTN